MPGFSADHNGTSQQIMYADNVDFSGADNNTVQERVIANGQLLIGASTSPKIRVNTLTAGAGITVTNGAGTITIASAGSIPAYTATAISYQVLITDNTIGVTSTAAARTITMPNSGMTDGQIWTIKDESGAAATNNITISGNGANIDGAATFVINNNFGAVNIYWNGSAFFIT